jgi:hypothetical protein
VYLLYALNKKHPNADKTFNWQYVFPSRRIATDPRTNIKRVKSKNWLAGNQYNVSEWSNMSINTLLFQLTL